MGATNNRTKSENELLQRIPAAVVIHRADTSIAMSNRAAQQLLGLTEDQMLGKSALDPAWKFFREDGTPMPLDEYPVNQVVATGKPLRNFAIGVYRPATQDTVWVLVSADPFWDDGELSEVVVSFSDITERMRVRAALKESEGRLTCFFDAAFEGIAFHQDGKVIDVNPQLTEILGYERSELVGKEVLSAVVEEDRRQVLDSIRSGFDKPYEHRAKCKDGSVVFLEVRGQQTIYKGRPARVTAVRDLTERRAAQQTLLQERDKLQAALAREHILVKNLERLANTDVLTNIANRRCVLEAGQAELGRAIRYGHDLALMTLDVDHFKRVNDTYGHGAGDAALKAFARLLEDETRAQDCFGRLGGEEFVVLLPEASMVAAQEVAERIRQKTSQLSIESDGRVFGFTVSIGVTAVAAVDHELSALLTRADLALYDAKACGRNCVRVAHTPLPSTG